MENEEKIYCWVEYIDDYNYKHLAPIREEEDFKYIKNTYNIVAVKQAV